MRVRLLDVDAGVERTHRIFGPWDAVLGDDVISYKAPLAGGLLGKEVGDEVSIRLPNADLRVRILSIELL